MSVNANSCYQCVDGGNPVKNGKTKKGKQRYLCKSCGTTFLEDYSYIGCKPEINKRVSMLINEGVGIRSASRILKISPSTVINKILRLAEKLSSPEFNKGLVFEIDEMYAYIGRKDKYIWVAYVLCRSNQKIAAVYVGKRTNKTLRNVVNQVHWPRRFELPKTL